MRGEAVRNIRLILEYDGSAFHGWQIQKNGVSIQETLALAISAITGEQSMPTGAGRTDAGVHAYGQVAAFQTESRISAERFSDALNAVLPRSVAVVRSEEAEAGFHPRRDATGKHYRYLVLNRPCRSALMAHRAWHVPKVLDFGGMQAAALQLVGLHDFRAFCASGHSVKTYTRFMTRAEWSQTGDFMQFDIEGSGFLYNMVRILVGTMVEVGRGRRTAEGFGAILSSGDRRQAGITAPPGGLYMMAVRYGEDAHDGMNPLHPCDRQVPAQDYDDMIPAFPDEEEDP